MSKQIQNVLYLVFELAVLYSNDMCFLQGSDGIKASQFGTLYREPATT